MAVGVGLVIVNNRVPESPAGLIQQEKGMQTVTESEESTVTVVSKTGDAGVPLPTEEDIVRTFFTLIDEGQADEAVLMMGKAVTDNDNYRQQWAVQFSAFESAELTSVEAYDRTNWTDKTHRYQILLNATMKPESVNQPVPYFGWDNGENTRWVTLIKENSVWKIESIGTGP